MRIRLNPSFFDHAPDQLIDQLIQFFRIPLRSIVQPLLIQLFGNPAHFDQLFDDRLLADASRSCGLLDIRIAVLETALEKEFRQLVEQFFEAEPIERRRYPLGVFGERLFDR